MRNRGYGRSPAQKLLMFSLVVGAVIGGYYWGNQHRFVETGFTALRALDSPRAMPDFKLIDHTGAPYSETELRGRWNLLFLGYTRSGGQTDAMLTLMVSTLNRLADRPSLRDRTSVVMLSIDPESDPPEELASYIGRYGPDFLAVTGDEQQLHLLSNAIGATFKSRPERRDDQPGGIDHSSSIALVNPQAELVGLFTGRVDAGSIADDIKQLADKERP